MPEDMLIARNPEEGTTLPYLIRLPLGTEGVILKTRETWPRTNKVYCHRLEQWPADAEVIERLAVRSISRRGAAIDLVLERGRENRSQFVLTRARGREMVFWQSRRTARQARPNVALPTARAHGRTLEITVDSRERYGYKFGDQQATTIRRALPAGDYAVYCDDVLVASAERKSIEDLSAGLLSGKLTYQLAELASLPRAAVVVESGYSRIFRLEHVSASAVAEALAEAQARFPSLPIAFVESRALAQEWIYRWLGACLHEHELHTATDFRGRPETPAAPEPVGDSEIRAWARERGLAVGDRGRISSAIVEQFYADRHR